MDGDACQSSALPTTTPAMSAMILLLRAALRHFAAHGLGAAADARNRALAAARAGDHAAYCWWLGLCAKLDRRMAASLRNTAIAS